MTDVLALEQKTNKEQQHLTNVGKILIPQSLPTILFSNKKQRTIICTWLRMKSLTTSGTIELNKALPPTLLISRNTLKTHLAALVGEGLVTINGNSIKLLSWKDFYNKYEILTEPKFYYVKNNCNLKYKLIELAIKENFNFQKIAIESKKKRKQAVNHTLSNGALVKVLLNEFRNQKQVTEININPIITLSQKTIAKKMQLANHTSARYYLKILEKLQVIKITPVDILNSPVRCQKSVLGTVNYCKQRKETFLRIANQIDFL